ncbi:hypothetical protein J6590_048311 [Homalodisca vitripennis]|nr:hypothetical protein J6590_048311 [Homalodisca vitripennis]
MKMEEWLKKESKQPCKEDNKASVRRRSDEDGRIMVAEALSARVAADRINR